MNVTVQDLNAFLEKNKPKLDTIKTKLNAFNIFNVLGVQHREIRHSNFLGWLFDPNESHELGDVFLQELFSLLNEKGFLPSELMDTILKEDLFETLVYRETKNNIDILIVNESLGFTICIENKIYANYSKDQLEKYYNYVLDNYPDVEHKIFLTLTPKSSLEHLAFDMGKEYNNISYSDILKAINLDSLGPVNNPSVKDSINQYSAMVEKSITKTSEEVRLAKEIYKKHKKEIDFIMAMQPDFSKYRKQIVSYFVKNNNYAISHKTRASYVFILPSNEALKKLFHYPEARSRNGEASIFSLVINLKGDTVRLRFSFGNVVESIFKTDIDEKRINLFDSMKDLPVFGSNNQFHESGFIKNKIDHNPAKKSFASIIEFVLFTHDELEMSGKEFLPFFIEQFNKFDTKVLQPWQVQCLEKVKCTKPEEQSESSLIG